MLAVWGLLANNFSNFAFYDDSFVSFEAVDYLKSNYDVQNLRLFNSYIYGAFLLYSDVPVFIDSRVNEYTREFDPSLERDIFADYYSVISLQRNWRDVIDYYDFDGYYISKDDALYDVLLLSPDVELVWENDTMVIFMTVDNQ